MKLIILFWCLLAFGCTDPESGLPGSRAEPEPPDSADRRLVMKKENIINEGYRIVRNTITNEYRIEMYSWYAEGWKAVEGPSLSDFEQAKRIFYQLKRDREIAGAWTEVVEP